MSETTNPETPNDISDEKLGLLLRVSGSLALGGGIYGVINDVNKIVNDVYNPYQGTITALAIGAGIGLLQHFPDDMAVSVQLRPGRVRPQPKDEAA